MGAQNFAVPLLGVYSWNFGAHLQRKPLRAVLTWEGGWTRSCSFKLVEEVFAVTTFRHEHKIAHRRARGMHGWQSLKQCSYRQCWDVSVGFRQQETELQK